MPNKPVSDVAKPAETIVETFETPVLGSYDVIVAGGGIAGCSAALAAARAGCSVLLIEKAMNLGGLATNGLVIYYNPSLCDQKGRRIIGGQAEEMMHAAVRYGGSTIPPGWSYRAPAADPALFKPGYNGAYRTRFLVPHMIAMLDELLLQAGVTLLFDTLCCGISMHDGCCEGIMVENKGGRGFYRCRQLVDTTGDLDLFWRAGAPVVEDLNWNTYWGLTLRIEDAKAAVERGDLQHCLKVRSFASGMDGKDNPPGLRRFTIESGEEVSQYILQGRAFFRDYIKTADPKTELPVSLPAQPQYRTTRRINGGYLLQPKDNGQHHEDSIGCAYTHKYGGVLLEFPYRSLVEPGYHNMITAGRTIASENPVRGLTRLIAPSAMTGEAAGTAAALALDRSCTLEELPVTELQDALVRQGGILHF